MSRSRSGGDETEVKTNNYWPRSGSLPNTNTKLKVSAMSATVSSKPIIPNYNSKNSINHSDLSTTTPLIKDLLQRGKIQIASKQRFNQDINILNSKKSLILCHVVPNKIIDNVNYTFQYDLLFGPYQNVSSNNNNFDPDNFEPIYYYYTLKISRKQLKIIHDTTIKQMTDGTKYFATKLYPKPDKKTKRKSEITNEMRDEEQYLLLPNIPKGKTIFNKKAEFNDLQNHGQYLEKLFSSAPLCLQDYIYELIKIDKQFKKLIKHKAGTKLQTLREISATEFLINPYKLTKKKGIEFNFHTLYVCQRPLSIRNQDSNFRVINFDHWALKFEGDLNLLTIEFFDDPTRAHGIVKCQILPNTRLNRRVFWYWWETETAMDIRNRNNNINLLSNESSQFFTKRWETIWKIYLNVITAECIGRLIIRWLRTNDYSIYQVAKNNCQHFVRDIVAVLDINVAKRLNSLFDHKVIASLLPAVAVADGMTEEVRMYEIRDILMGAIQQYNNDKKMGKIQEKKMEEKHIENNNLITVENFNLCGDWIVEEEKKKMIEYMKKNGNYNGWGEYFEVVENYINMRQNNDTEIVLGQIKSPVNTPLWDALNKLNDKKSVNEFIGMLGVVFKHFQLDESDDEIEEKSDEKVEEEEEEEMYVLKRCDSNKYDKLYCDGQCNNMFGKYILELKTNGNNMNAKDKLLVIATFFMSYDYELRLELISLIEKHFFIKINNGKRIMNNKNQNSIIKEMLYALKNENEYFQIDMDNNKKNNKLKWVYKFDNLFKEFMKKENNKCFILDELCIKSCKRFNNNVPLIEEFIQNTNKIQIDMGYIPIIKKCLTNMGMDRSLLTNNEILSLFTFIKYKNEFINNEKINSCVWKQFYSNLCSAFNKIYKGKVLNRLEKNQYPMKLYCYTKQIEINMNNKLIVNSISIWYVKKPLFNGNGSGKYIYLNNAKKYILNSIVKAIPIHWINMPMNNANNNIIDSWLLMPFQAEFTMDENDTNSLTIDTIN